MADYKNIIELIDKYIYENRYQKITGTVLNTVLRAMVSSLGAGYQLAGILRASDNPKATDQRVAYLAVEPGTYQYAGGFEVTELSLLTYGAEWHMYPLGVPFGSQIAEDITAAVESEKTRAIAAEKALQDNINKKQDTLESGTNIKTVNGESLLGSGDLAIREGLPTIKAGEGQFSEIFNFSDTPYHVTRAVGIKSHAEGSGTVAGGAFSHAEGCDTGAYGEACHAEGEQSQCGGTASHAEGYNNKSNNYNSDAPGDRQGMHIEGAHNRVYVNMDGAHIEGAFHKGIKGRGLAYFAGCHIGGSCYLDQRFDSAVINRVIGAGTDKIPKNAFALVARNYDGHSGATEPTSLFYFQGIGGYTGKEDNVGDDIKDLATVISELESEKQDVIPDLETIRKQAANGQTAFEWGDHKTAGYVKPFVITLTGGGSTENPYRVDKGAEETATAIDDNRPVYLRHGDHHYPLMYALSAKQPYLVFAVTWADDNALWAYILQNQEGDAFDISYYDFSYVLTNQLKTINGNRLIGGGDLKVGVPTMKAGQGEKAEVFNGLGPSNASGISSHAEGANSVAEGHFSHAEGNASRTSGWASHAEGQSQANGDYSHSEGDIAVANGTASHAEGKATVATRQNSHAEGQFNVSDGAAIHSVGIGTADNARKDAHRITLDGKHYIPGIGGFDGTKSTEDLNGEKDLATVINELESASGPFALTLTLGTGDKWSMDCTFEELAAAVDAKRGVIFTMSGGAYDGDAFTATVQLHSSAGHVVVMQGYVNKASIYVVVTNGSTGLTVDVSEVNLVNIDTTIPAAPSNENVPSTKLVKDYVDKYAPCVIKLDEFMKPGISVPYAIKSGELSPNRVIVLEANKSSGIGRYNVFGFQNDGGVTCHGYVVSSTTGEMVQLVFDMPNQTLAPSGNI